MTSRICNTSWSVSCDTRRASGIPTFPMISLAFFGPMPWIYCNAIMTRLLVGMLTPAMRATVNHSFCRPIDGGQRSRGRFANDNATPSPSRRARYRSTSPLGCALLMDSTSFRQPPPGVAFAPGRRARGPRAAAALGGFRFSFHGLGRFDRPRFRLAGGGSRHLRSWFLVHGLLQPLADRPRHLRNSDHAVHRAQHALELVIRHERRCLVAVGQEPAPQHLRIVVFAQRLAPRRHLGDPLLDPLKQDGFVDLEFDTASSVRPFSLSMRSSACACGTVRGKPSRIKPLRASGSSMRSETIATTTSSGTSSPRAIISLARSPIGLPASTAARSISPVES